MKIADTCNQKRPITYLYAHHHTCNIGGWNYDNDGSVETNNMVETYFRKSSICFVWQIITDSHCYEKHRHHSNSDQLLLAISFLPFNWHFCLAKNS